MLKEYTEEGDECAEAFYLICGAKPSRVKAFEATLELWGKPQKFEIDTGASRTALSEETFNKLWEEGTGCS